MELTVFSALYNISCYILDDYSWSEDYIMNIFTSLIVEMGSFDYVYFECIGSFRQLENKTAWTVKKGLDKLHLISKLRMKSHSSFWEKSINDNNNKNWKTYIFPSLTNKFSFIGAQGRSFCSRFSKVISNKTADDLHEKPWFVFGLLLCACRERGY